MARRWIGIRRGWIRVGLIRPDPKSRVTSRHFGLGQGGNTGVHVEIEPTVRVHVFPDQRRQGVQVSGVQSAGPQ